MRHAGYACGPKIDPRISLSNTLISLDLTTPIDSLFLFLPFFLSWLRGSCRVTGCCHGGCLSSSLTSITLYHHAQHSFVRGRGGRRKTTSFYIGATNRWLEETTASKMILAYPCVHACHAWVCMCSKIYPCDDRPPKEKLPLLRWSCRVCVTRVCICVSGKISARGAPSKFS